MELTAHFASTHNIFYCLNADKYVERLQNFSNTDTAVTEHPSILTLTNVDDEDVKKARRTIWGPFLYIIRFTGQLRPFKPKQKLTVAQKLLHCLPALLSGVPLLARTIYMFAVMMGSTSMTINWAYTNILFFMALHGFVSSLMLMNFKFKNFMDRTAKLLVVATRNDITVSPSLVNIRWMRSYFVLFAMLSASVMYCVDDYVLYDRFVTTLEKEHSSAVQIESFRKSMCHYKFLLPLDFVIIVWGGLMSAICLCLYDCANATMTSEFAKFNSKIQSQIDNGKILQCEAIKAIDDQLIDFLHLANHITHNNASLLSISFLGGFMMQINAQFALRCFFDYLGIGIITFCLWTATSVIMLVVAVVRPASLYSLSRHTMEMLYLDDSIWKECSNMRLQNMVSGVIDRIEKIDYANKTPAPVRGSFALFSLIMIIIPFVVVLLSIYKQMPEFKH